MVILIIIALIVKHGADFSTMVRLHFVSVVLVVVVLKYFSWLLRKSNQKKKPNTAWREQEPVCYFCFRYYISLIRSKVSKNYLSRGDGAVPSCCRLCGGGILPLLYEDNSSLNLVPLWFFCTVAPEPYGSCLLILLIPFNHEGPMLNRCGETRATYASKLGSPLKGNYIRAPQKKKKQVGGVVSAEMFNQWSDKEEQVRGKQISLWNVFK